MKRCIICGNTGDENSTVCNVCGGPFGDTVSDRDNMSRTQDMAQITKQLEEMLQNSVEDEDRTDVELQLEEVLKDDELAGAKAAVTEISLDQDEKRKPEREQESVKAEPAERPAYQRQKASQEAENRQPRRMKSEPQIYGQAQMGDMAAYNGQQGMMRRNMQGRPAPQGQPANGAPQGRPMAPQGQPVNRAPQGRPMAPQGQPANGAPQGRPMAPQGQPVNGAPQGRPMAPQGQPVNGAPQGRPMAPQGQPANGAPQGRYVKAVMETARTSMKSPLFFLIVLLNTVSLAGSAAAIFLKELNYAQFARLITDMDLPVQIAGYMDEFKNIMVTLDTSAVGLNLALLIPDLLFCLGLWLIFLCALGAKEEMPTVGFGLMKIVVIFQMILGCIAVLAGLIVSVTLVVAAWASGTQTMIIGAIVTMVVMIIAAMMVIMYFFCYFATIKTCRLSAKTGETFGNASGYVALVHIIGALTCIISLLSGIVNAEISNTAGSIGKMGWMILFGLWIFGYKKNMKEFTKA